MPATFDKELGRLSRTKRLISLLPARLRFRAAKRLYNYLSADVRGIDLVAPLGDDGLLCFVNTKDLIGWKIFFFGEYEEGTNAVIKKYVKDTDVVIEAGANIGSESLLLSRLAARGQVYCFEPNPYVFERLNINVAINELANVHTFDCALGESDKSITFNIFPRGYSNAGMSSKYMENADTKKITVAQKTLDAFIAEQGIKKVDFIKMDIQGAEMDMINGANETISRFRPIIFTEACEPYNDTGKLYARLRGYGYNIYLIGDNSTRLMADAADVKDGNWLAICEK